MTVVNKNQDDGSADKMGSCKDLVKQKLDLLLPYLNRAALGDFSKMITVPDVGDEFTPLLVSINSMLSSLAGLQKQLEHRAAVLKTVQKDLQITLEKKVEELEKSEARFDIA